jgi:hypothetical protein
MNNLVYKNVLRTIIILATSSLHATPNEDLHHACMSGDYDAAERAIGEGANVNDTDNSVPQVSHDILESHSIFDLFNQSSPVYAGNEALSPLMCAAAYGRNDIINLLLRQPSFRDEDGICEMALAFAAANNHASTVGVILQNKPNIQNDGIWASFLCAIHFAHFNCVQELITQKPVEILQFNKLNMSLLDPRLTPSFFSQILGIPRSIYNWLTGTQPTAPAYEEFLAQHVTWWNNVELNIELTEEQQMTKAVVNTALDTVSHNS